VAQCAAMIAGDTSGVTVSYFAAARELCGTGQERLELAAPIGSKEFLDRLAARHARLAPLAHRMRLAINGELADGQATIRPGDEIAVLPPVAGGSESALSAITSAISDQPLSVDRAIAAVAHPAAGGIAVFIGTVRDQADGKPVARLDYEAHTAMAEKELRRVLEEIHAADPSTRLCAIHRVGELRVTDLAIVVAASAPHRAEAFAACRAAIEQIKQRVPVWKKEWSPEGSANWVNLES
jgi:molybdopterin synthase catalytic subunit/molybdopterin converting factor small subunit